MTCGGLATHSSLLGRLHPTTPVLWVALRPIRLEPRCAGSTFLAALGLNVLRSEVLALALTLARFLETSVETRPKLGALVSNSGSSTSPRTSRFTNRCGC